MVMDLELVPLKLRLKGLVTIEVSLLVTKIKKTVFEKNIWEYSTAQITKRIIDVSTKEEDKSPPEFLPVVAKVRGFI